VSRPSAGDSQRSFPWTPPCLTHLPRFLRFLRFLPSLQPVSFIDALAYRDVVSAVVAAAAAMTLFRFKVGVMPLLGARAAIGWR